VKIGIDKSRRHLEENGTPQGISPLLFNIMLDVFFFSNVQPGIGKSLFADNSLWKRGKDVKYTLKKVSSNPVEARGRKWGFRLSVEKTTLIFL